MTIVFEPPLRDLRGGGGRRGPRQVCVSVPVAVDREGNASTRRTPPQARRGSRRAIAELNTWRGTWSSRTLHRQRAHLVRKISNRRPIRSVVGDESQVDGLLAQGIWRRSLSDVWRPYGDRGRRLRLTRFGRLATCYGSLMFYGWKYPFRW